MKHQELIDSIIEVAEEKGWRVKVEEATRWNSERMESESIGDILNFDFQQYSDAGQDFYFSAQMKYGDVNTLIESISDYYEGYDPDEEAMLWAGPDGHGKNGAPYRLSDIIKDMEQCEEMVKDLLYAIDEAYRNGHFDELDEEK